MPVSELSIILFYIYRVKAFDNYKVEIDDTLFNRIQVTITENQTPEAGYLSLPYYLQYPWVLSL
jgi:hypothetical protein